MKKHPHRFCLMFSSKTPEGIRATEILLNLKSNRVAWYVERAVIAYADGYKAPPPPIVARPPPREIPVEDAPTEDDFWDNVNDTLAGF